MTREEIIQKYRSDSKLRLQLEQEYYDKYKKYPCDCLGDRKIETMLIDLDYIQKVTPNAEFLNKVDNLKKLFEM